MDRVFYPRLISEMAQRGVKKSEIAKHLNITGRALYNKLQGETAFTWPEAVAIQRDFFPDVSKEELFERVAEAAYTPEKHGYISGEYGKIVVLDLISEQEFAVITNDLITTARDSIVVKLLPNGD